jgi:hypothetical protein
MGNGAASALIAALSTCAVACGGGIDEQLVAGQCESIYLGRPDPYHGAVVALLDNDGALVCTAALVGTARGRAAFLTAAHCLDRVLVEVAVGRDYTSPTDSLGVWTAITHPDFDRSTGRFDVALVLSEQDPAGVSPLRMATDATRDVATGERVRFVGYGSNDSDVPVSIRQDTLGSVETLTETEFDYSQAEGGPCFGDSGGPALRTDEYGWERIVGVSSYGDHGCRSRGTSARLSAARDFLSAELDPPRPDCASDSAPRVSSERMPLPPSILDSERSEIWKGHD